MVLVLQLHLRDSAAEAKTLIKDKIRDLLLPWPAAASAPPPPPPPREQAAARGVGDTAEELAARRDIQQAVLRRLQVESAGGGSGEATDGSK